MLCRYATAHDCIAINLRFALIFKKSDLQLQSQFYLQVLPSLIFFYKINHHYVFVWCGHKTMHVTGSMRF